MSRVCQVTGKKPQTGNNVSHSRVSTKGLRIIDKKGIDAVLSDLRARGEKV